MQRRLGIVLALLLLMITTAAPAQQEPGPTGPMPVLTISPDGLFAGTRYGQAVQARIDTAARALQDENRTSEAALAAEEQSLTDRRTALPPAEFRLLAEAFDRKANGIRETQTAKARAISEMRDTERQRFFQAVLPVLGQIMTDNGAVAIIDQSSVFLSFDRIDITTTAIARIDALLGEGPAVPNAADDVQPAPTGPPIGPTGPSVAQPPGAAASGGAVGVVPRPSAPLGTTPVAP